MLVVCPTQSLARRMQIKPDAGPRPPVSHPLLEWYARDFRLGQSQLVLFTNPLTCLSFVQSAAPYKKVGERFQQSLIGHFVDLGWAGAHERLGALVAEGIEYAKSVDRSTTGIMNQVLLELEMELEMGRASLTDLESMNRRLRTAMIGGARPGGYKYPSEHFEELVGIRPPDNVRRIY